MNGLSKEEIEEVRAKMPPSIAKTATDEEVTRFWTKNIFKMPAREDLLNDVISILKTSEIIVEGKWHKEYKKLIIDIILPKSVWDAQYEAERLYVLFGEFVERKTPIVIRYNGGEVTGENAGEEKD